MTDRPILFSKPMVQALLAGTKTQTRRIGDRPRIEVGDMLWVREAWRAPKTLDVLRPRDMEPRKNTIMFEAGGSIANQDFRGDWRPSNWPIAGQREDWVGRRRASMHLPRWASRMTLVVTEVRVQRLLELSEEDAIAEGMVRDDRPGSESFGAWSGGVDYVHGHSAYGAYRRTWEIINGAGSWKENPFVIAYSFTMQLANIDCL